MKERAQPNEEYTQDKIDVKYWEGGLTLRIKRLQKTTFADRCIRERQDIQRLLIDQIEIITGQTLVIAEDFDD